MKYTPEPWVIDTDGEGKPFAIITSTHDKNGVDDDVCEVYGGNGDDDAENPDIRMSVATPPVFVEDIPNENWLQGKVREVMSRPRDSFGVPIMMSVTGYFDGNVQVPVRWAAQVPGMRDEQNRVRQNDLAAIRRIIQETGRFPIEAGREYVPFINIGHDGLPWVNEGNHRIMAAASEGWDYIPVELRYFDGGQRRAGKWSPDNLVEITDRVSREKALESGNKLPGRCKQMRLYPGAEKTETPSRVWWI